MEQTKSTVQIDYSTRDGATSITLNVEDRIIDDKHVAVLRDTGIQILKASNGTIVPDEEPMILFRGRDHLAIPMLEYYLELCCKDGCTDHQIDPLRARIGLFAMFRDAYPDRMKQPGITLGR